MATIIDLKMVCLVCLQYEKRLHNVFMPDEENPELQIADKISCCSDLKLDADDDKFSNKICETCMADLHAAWRFRQNCDTALNVLHSMQQQQLPEHDQLEENEEHPKAVVLSRQKVSMPQGLKIKNVQPQTKTYFMTIDLDERNTKTIELKKKNSANLITTKKNWPENDEDVKTVNIQFENHITGQQIDSDEDNGFVQNDDILSVDETDIGHNEEYVEFCMTEEVLDEYIDDANGQSEDSKINNVSSPKSPSSSEWFTVEMGDTELTKSINVIASTEQPQQRRLRGRPRKYAVNQIKGDTNYKSSNNTNVNTFQRTKSYVDENDSFNQSDSPDTAETLGKVRKRRCRLLSPDSKPLKICEICGNSYRYQHALNAHMRRHNNDRPFSCEFCEKAFISNVELRRHIRVHTGQRPYGCQYCERRFSDFGSRIKHERTHTGERPYRCETCGKTFAYAHVLSVHLRTHTGEKKFRCDQCGKGFTKKAYLLSHIQNHVQLGHLESEDIENASHDRLVSIDECVLTPEYIDDDAEECEQADVEDIDVNMFMENRSDEDNS